MSQDGCIRGYMVYPIERALEHEIFAKMCFFQKVTPNFFYISDILVQKLKLFVFYMMLNSQVLKKVSFQEKRRKIKT